MYVYVIRNKIVVNLSPYCRFVTFCVIEGSKEVRKHIIRIFNSYHSRLGVLKVVWWHIFVDVISKSSNVEICPVTMADELVATDGCVGATIDKE